MTNTIGGSRAIALGGAFVAIADDPSAIFYNPAGLASATLRTSYITIHFNRAPKNNYVGYISFVHVPSEDEKWGFGVAVLSSFYTAIKKYNASGTRVGSSLYYGTAAYFSLARKLGDNDKYSIGFNFKFIHRSIGGALSYGGGIDFGFKGSVSFIDFGLFIGDLVTIESFSDSGEIIYYDRMLKLSIAGNLSSSFVIAFQIDKNISTEDEFIYRFGAYVKLWGATKDSGSLLKSASKDNTKGVGDLSKEVDIKDKFKDALYLNFGYGDSNIGFGFTLTIWRLGFDVSVSFKELSLDKTNFLFSVNVPLY